MGQLRDRVDGAICDFLLTRGEPRFGPERRHALAAARGRVLEVGAGAGHNVPHYPAGIDELVLLEPSPSLLTRALRRAADAGRAATGVAGSAEALPFPDASFDTVVSLLVLCTVADPDAALREIRRVLRPDGQLLFLEHVRADEPRLARWQDRLERPWGVLAMGCHPNRATLERIEAGRFAVAELERRRFPGAPPLVRPLVVGRAVPAE